MCHSNFFRYQNCTVNSIQSNKKQEARSSFNLTAHALSLKMCCIAGVKIRCYNIIKLWSPDPGTLVHTVLHIKCCWVLTYALSIFIPCQNDPRVHVKKQVVNIYCSKHRCTPVRGRLCSRPFSLIYSDSDPLKYVYCRCFAAWGQQYYTLANTQSWSRV